MVAASPTPGSSSREVDDGTAGIDLAAPLTISRTQTVSKIVTENYGYLRRQARVINQEIDERHQQSYLKEWRDRTVRRSRLGPAEILEELSELGFAWRDIAQLAGVTVQAVQKWRRGTRLTGENRHRLAGLLAACDLVAEDYEIREVASWFEMPLSDSVPVSPLDLWTAKRPDLVFEYASGHVDTERILTSWMPDWRERYQSNFEVFSASDGILSIRSKER